MSNVITFHAAVRRSRSQNLSTLMIAVAQNRRRQGDVFWLKENAEVLGMLAATRAVTTVDDLAPYAEFYDQIEEKLRFYPQYYRFFLSICLDLEDLGFDGGKGEAMCQWVADAGLVKAELSDLQRAEARRLLARRGVADLRGAGMIDDRLRRFAERAETFALPNKKAAYELTHIVFYLSEYGGKDPQLSEDVVTSLHFIGVLAYLDQNHDLLAEVCTALHFVGAMPSPVWIEAVAQAHSRILPVVEVPKYPNQDAFHAYLVTGWTQTVLGGVSFEAQVSDKAPYFISKVRRTSVLRPLSECLYDLGPLRNGDWGAMRHCLMSKLDIVSQEILKQAETSTQKFAAFFQGFARASASRNARTG
ncbi:MAG: hypothetical protein WA782_02185 [Sulfitobacter sp.]